jgi:Tfp pilus assembly protein PilN
MRELEFLPPDYIRARFQRRIGFIRSWLLLVMGLAMTLWSLQMGLGVRGARAELQALRGTGSAVDADLQKVQRLRQEARHYDRRIDFLQTLKSSVTAADVVAAITGLLPESVQLEELYLDRPDAGARQRATVRLVGIAPSETVVMETLAALESSPVLDGAVLVQSKPYSGADLAEPEEAAGRRFVLEVGVVSPLKE